MSGRRQLYLLAYDIASPDRLRAVARLAQDHGVRIQYSVFLLQLTPARRDNLLKRLERIIHPRQDDVRLYPLPDKPAWELHGREHWPPGIWLSISFPEAKNAYDRDEKGQPDME